MLSKYILLLATALEYATAQSSDIVPQELQSAFADSSVELQVSFTGDASTGFSDGSTFSKDGMSQTT